MSGTKNRKIPRMMPVYHRAGALILAILTVVLASSNPSRAIVPQYSVDAHGVHIKGVSPSSAIIYDNDWWSDIFDDNYLWAQAHLGKADLRANIVTRDMWNHPNYTYSMTNCLEDARKAIALARDSGLTNIPDAIAGADMALNAPKSRKIAETRFQSTPGSRRIIAEALKASAEKPLVIIAGGPLTTIANALLEKPEIANRIIVFALSVSYYGYNGKDGWSVYIVAKRTRLVEWATREFWDRNSVFSPADFRKLPDNPFCNDMKRLINSKLGQANQLGDGSPLVWLYANQCWTGAVTRNAVFDGRAVNSPKATPGDFLDIPKKNSDLKAMRTEFFHVIENLRL